MRNLKGVFSNNEHKIIPYCIYWNLRVNAVIGHDGKLQICDDDKQGQRCAMFFLSEDKIYEGVIVQSMKMSDFIEMAKEQKADYIDICNTTQCIVSRFKIDKVDMYKKEVLDEYLNSGKNKTDQFSFLMEDGLLIRKDSDKNTLSGTTLHQIMEAEMHHAFDEILDRAGCESFDELFKLVEIGKNNIIKN